MLNNIAKPGQFCWNRLMTHDVKRAREFYCNLFGWTTTEIDMGTFIYTTFNLGETPVGGLLQTPAGREGTTPQWLSFIAVADINESVNSALTLGASIILPITTVGNNLKMAIIADPVGAHIGFRQNV